MNDLPEDSPLLALGEQVAQALPQKGESVEEWAQREIMSLAVMGKLANDIWGAIAAHRLLADMHGSLRGGYRERRGQDIVDMTPEEQEEEILRAAEEIKAKRARDCKSDGVAKRG